MASLILHGDLNLNEQPLGRPLYVRPILRPNAQGGEYAPPDHLFVDVIYQAVRRIKEGDGAQDAVAPNVLLINFSIGDKSRPFAGVISPLARLLDYLAHEYRVLFLVSAGNILDRLNVAGFQTFAQFEAATPEERERAILTALNANKSRRTLLSPAEAVNVLTIGAAHAGSAFTGQLPANRFDPFTTGDGPNIISAMGLGFKKTVKPELLFEGGRMPIRLVGSGDELVIEPVVQGANLFGVKAAMPSPRGLGGTRYEDFCCGTSVATALATRAAHRIHDFLTDASGNHSDIGPDFMPLLLKALLVHSAQWGPKGSFLDTYFGPQGAGSHNHRRDDITRLLGYGAPQIERVLDCAENQATLVGHGSISVGSGLLYRIPLPEDLEGVRAFRSVTTTLAWLSPVNSRHQAYRAAALDISPASDEKYWIASRREPYQPTDKAIVRGTMFHEHRSGEEAQVFVDDGHLLLRISCRATAGEMAEAIPYALAVTFEVGVDAEIAVYQQVRTRLEAQVHAAVGV